MHCHQIMFGWETYKCYYETVELPNPRPTQTHEKVGKKWQIGPLFPTANEVFRGLGLVLYRKQQTTKNPTQTKFSANTLYTQKKLLACFCYHGLGFREMSYQ